MLFRSMLLAAALLFLGTVSVMAQSPGSGIITEITGTVEIKHAGTADFIAAKNGDALAQNTVISTGFKSIALVTVGSSVITVKPMTRLTLGEITASAGAETINVSLQTGRVRVDVNPPAETRATVTVRSPVATASVRGTSFEFDTQSITVLSGTVAFQGTNGKVMLVNAGSASQVTGSGRAADPSDSFTAELRPPPIAGGDSGFQQKKNPDSSGEISFTLIMK